jgi:SAM-dependent methyltransferase
MNCPQLRLACPRCHGVLHSQGSKGLVCPKDRLIFSQRDGIWRCLLPGRKEYYAQFLSEYDAVRTTEGRGSHEPAYYQALPFSDLTGRFRQDWRLRSRTFRTFIDRVLAPLENNRSGPLRILDLGAGNGWLSNRLAQRGHALAALDLRTGQLDGLGALRHYNLPILAVQAEFDRLPFPRGEFDLLVFNASLHYSTDYRVTLQASLGVLNPTGQLAILDTPFYNKPESGQAMVRERQENFRHEYGFPSDSLPSENFLTAGKLESLRQDLHLDWCRIQPFWGLSWLLKPWRARLRGRREPANFPILLGRQA